MFSTSNFSFFTQKSESLNFNPEDVEEILNERESFNEKLELSGSEQIEVKTDPEDDNIFSQLKNKLEVKKEVFIESEKLEKFWSGLSFKFAKPSAVCQNEIDSYFRLHFNPVEYSNLSCFYPDLKENQEKKNKSLVEDESEKLNILEESPENQKSSEEKVSRIVLTKNIKALKEICDEFDEEDVVEIKSKQLPIKFQSKNMTDAAERLSPCEIKLPDSKNTDISTKSDKITKIMLKNFFKSLSDEESGSDADNMKNSLITLDESLLSKISKKVRQKKTGTPSEYNEMLGNIVKLDSQAMKHPSKLSPANPPDLQKIPLNFKENTPMNHQKPVGNQVCFKNQTPKNISAPPKIDNNPKLISNKTYDDLNKLSHRFKLDFQKPGPSAKKENLNQTNFSIFDMSKKLQLRASTSQTTKNNLQRDGRIEKSKDESKSNMNINKYLNEFCRKKFTD